MLAFRLFALVTLPVCMLSASVQLFERSVTASAITAAAACPATSPANAVVSPAQPAASFVLLL